MLTRSDIQRKLLQKFDELCRKANVKYVLHGHVAFLAYHDQPIENVNSVEVMMCQGDAEKVSGILDDDDYYFEDSKSNHKFDRPYMMFGYKNSIDMKNKDLDFNITRHIDNQCIRIIINYIEKPPSEFTKKVISNNRKILKFRYMESDFNYRNFKSKRKITNNVFKVINDNLYNNMVYRYKKRAVSIKSWDDIKKYPFIKVTGKRPVESNIFSSIVPASVDGISSFILGDFEKYATFFYGNNWRIKQWPKVTNCTSSIISWQEYSNDPEVKKCIAEIHKRYDIIHGKYARTLDSRDEIKYMKRQVRQSKSVIYVREETIQQKDKIMELYQAENMKELERILNPLIKSLSVGVDLGYTYSVDNDIDEIVDSYLRKTNNSDLANQIKEFRTEV